MKPTLRRSGGYMVTMRVEHHLSGEDVVNALAYYVSRFGDIDEPLNRKQAEGEIRAGLTSQGEAIAYWRDGYEESDAAEIEAWATALVRNYWPKLLPE